MIHCEVWAFLSPHKVFGLGSSSKKWFRHCHSSFETTTRQPPFDNTSADWSLAFVIDIYTFISNSVSVLQLLFRLSEN